MAVANVIFLYILLSLVVPQKDRLYALVLCDLQPSTLLVQLKATDSRCIDLSDLTMLAALIILLYCIISGL